MNTHYDWDTLNDYADGSIAPAQRADVARHIEACAECRDTVTRLHTLLANVAQLPKSMDPPASAWTAIKGAVESGKVIELPGRKSKVESRTGPGSRVYGLRSVRLAAAAVALISVSSTVTAVLMQKSDNDPVVATQGATPIQLASLPADIAATERTYLSTVDELAATLTDPSVNLSPETIKSVQRSLKIIDDAIAEARQALLDDPASDLLRAMLSRNYQQKVDLLRRVSVRATS